MSDTEAASAALADPTARRSATLAIGVFALALVVRALHLWQLRDSPFLAFELGDAQSYDAWAREIAAGDWLGSEVFYQAPLYPYFLGAIYAALGDDPLLVRGVQALLGALACALLAAAGARFFSRGAGAIAGLVLALYAPALFFDSLLQKSALDLFLVSLLLWLLARALDAPNRAAWGWTGLALGALVLSRENAVVWVAALLLPLARQVPRARRLACTAAFALGLAAALLPVALRNQLVGGEFFLTTAQFGPNFYIGNHPGADGGYAPLVAGRGSAKFERADATALAERALGRELGPREVSRYWTGRALDYIGGQPADWLRLLARKFALLWDATERVDTEDQYTMADWSLPLRASGWIFHFGAVAPLAALGLWATWPRRARLLALYAMLAAYAASVLLFYVFARYRYPLVPLLVLFAGAGLAGARDLRRRSSGRTLAACAGLVLGVAVFSNWPITSKARMRAVTYYNFGNAFKVDGQAERAIEHYRRALALEPDFAEAHHNLAATLADRGALDEALAHYREKLRLVPRDAPAHNNIGNLLRARGQLGAAVDAYERALRIDPDYADAHYNLGLALAAREDWGAATRHLRRAVELQPDNTPARRQLTRVRRRAARSGEPRGRSPQRVERDLEGDRLGAEQQ